MILGKEMSYQRKMRFMGHLININNENFEKNIQNIYPAELELQKKNKLMKMLTFYI